MTPAPDRVVIAAGELVADALGAVVQFDYVPDPPRPGARAVEATIVYRVNGMLTTATHHDDGYTEITLAGNGCVGGSNRDRDMWTVYRVSSTLLVVVQPNDDESIRPPERTTS